MMAEGVRAPFLPEFPSKTFPNHYSMATGLTPGQHGIVINSFFDPVRKATFLRTSATDGSWFGGEPIWATAQRAGLKVAAYFWTGSEAEIGGVRPRTGTCSTRPFPTRQNRRDHALAAPAAGGASQSRHDVLPVVDVPGHRYGPEAPRDLCRRPCRRPDASASFAIRSRSLAGTTSISSSCPITDSYPFRATTTSTSTACSQKGALVDDEHATLSIWQDPAGPTLNMDSLAAALRKTIPHMRLFRPGSFPAEWQTEQNRRFGDLFLLADPGYEFVSTVPRSLYTLGEHGYDPRTPEMMGTFLAVGPDFRPGTRLAARENRTLHELLIHLLGLQNPLKNAVLPEFGLRR